MIAQLRAAALVCLVVLAGCAPERPGALKPGERAIILLGTVYPVQEAEVRAPVTGVVREVLVQPSQRVRAQAVVVRLENEAFLSEVRKAEAAVALARANLAQARTGPSEGEIAAARAEVDRARLEVERQRRLLALPPPTSDHELAIVAVESAEAKLDRLFHLHRRGLASRVELENAQNEYAEARRRYRSSPDARDRRETFGDLDVGIAEARYRAARARLAELEGGPPKARIQAATAQLRQAELDLSRARRNVEQATVVAQIGGTVTDVVTQPGEKVYERSPLLKIVEIQRVEIRADLSPGLLPHVRVGQKARITVNTVPPTEFQASIHRIQTVADPKTQSVVVTFLAPNPDLKFQPGFTARVEIGVDPGQPPIPKEPARPADAPRPPTS